MEELCRERHEGYGHKGGNGAGPLCLEEYYSSSGGPILKEYYSS